MEPVERLVRVTVPDNTVEVRVHGVSGTPPQALLGAYPVRVDGDVDAGFYRAPSLEGDGGVAEAFSWGGLTSRKRVTAFWLFLAPLSMINVAGWMSPIPSQHEGGTRAQDLRDAAMRVVTALATVLVAIISFQAAATVLGLVGPGPRADAGAAALALGFAAVVPLGLQGLSRVGGMPDDGDQHDDPWGRVQSFRSLAAAHLGLALATVAGVGSAALDLWAPLTGWDILVLVLAVGAGALGVLAILGTDANGTDRGTWMGSWSRRVGGAAVVAAVTVAALGAAPSEAAERLTVVHFALAGAVAMVLGVLWLAERRMPVRGSAGYSVAVAVFGFFMSYSAFGALSYGLMGLVSDESFAEFVADPEPPAMFHFIDFAAVILTCGVLYVAARVVGNVRPSAPAGELGVDAATRLRSAVGDATGDLRRAGVGMLVAAIVFVLAELVSLGFPEERWAQLVGAIVAEPRELLGAAGWVFVAYLLFRIVRGSAKAAGVLIGALVGAAGLGWVLARGGVDLLAWARVDSDSAVVTGASQPWLVASSFTLIAVVVALFFPAVAVIWFIISMSGERESRRGVGILWDLTNFWPRMYHPWAPPPYSETAIPALERRLQRLHQEHPDDALVLSCHSQGAVLGFPVMQRLVHHAEVRPASLRFLTYGNLLAKHYQELFPHLFDDDRLKKLAAESPGRWINLHRETDPLGHRVSVLGEANDRVASHKPPAAGTHVLTHANYGYSPEYQAALDDLGGDIAIRDQDGEDALGHTPAGWRRLWLRARGARG